VHAAVPRLARGTEFRYKRPQAVLPSASAAELAPHASSRFDRWALARIQGLVRTAPVTFMLWDGYEIPPASGPAIGTILFRHRGALLSWLWDAELNFGETYMSGTVELHGDLFRMLDEIYRALEGPRRRRWRRVAANDTNAAKHNVHHHYDIGNQFYRLWLDREMVYTCAYFPAPDATLEDAQLTKMDLVCRKLHLRPGERVIEAGCGWGSLALYMARQYGVAVRAFNISTEQIAYARERARAERLDGRVEFIEDDYRNVRGTCDAFVSVGMLEHVGRPDYPTLGRVIARSLSPAGRGFLHFIGRNHSAPLNAWIRKRIFPGAYAPTLREVCEQVLEPHRFSVLDVENLRLHYAKTLEHWRRRFLNSASDVAAMFDDSFVRAWDLYLAGSQASFATGSLELFQVVFTRGGNNEVPWTRISGLASLPESP
jgi:cyclopropane-fatty-acyl-phospholipid synthase